ncbi:CDP-glycerol glycerophosphotransferase family protein [Vagococcus sp. CY53-2]|uniref:CDP-glycerol glycerophosphotransferase family protein n=1 Tax=Vagococcus sp. CY53-2 TaxID=2925780 RepID=UPI001F505963|nr:CDP-glycerol glycerophosphotransferase family protein [Vagococcus sp. CY53-2]MCI0130562.1 CDP-glycerol glycerophosphotransferase family protein [Vagococcus sp. CY53-2]
MALYGLKRKSKSDFNKKKSEYYGANYESAVIDEDMIVYESRDGKSIVDSPYAIFLSLVNDKRFSNFKHVWVINPNVPFIKESIPQDLRKKVIFVERTSLEYVKVLLTAKYLINNSTFESFFVKKNEQVYINTWHGTPLKYMGFDIPGNPNHSQNVLRNFLMADYILSPNAHTSDIFIKSYKLEGIYPGKILEGGYPRIDFTLHSNKADVINKIENYGVTLTGKKIILFCPTWKGQSVHKATDDIDQIVEETLQLANQFEDEYDVLVKVHPFIADKVLKDGRINQHLVSNLIDANEVLAITDILVTDYSSIFFDYLVTNKPIIFYAWDRDLYQINRGMYLEESELPGPTAETLRDLFDCINHVEESHKEYQKVYKSLAKKMVPYDDGKVTEKYIARIFENIKTKDIKEYQVDSDKKKILLFPGAMKSNGITSSALNLINNIDYSEYDVTVILNSRSPIESVKNIKEINKNARLIFRFGHAILSREEEKLNNNFNVNGLPKDDREIYPEQAYKREMARLTANLSFDVSIDFSGYSYFWGRHILSANAKKYVAFMHNDLVADSMREVNGKMPQYNDLNALFSIYFMFDKLLSVSPMTRDVNLEKLGDYVTKEQMSYVYNTINIDQILGKKESIMKKSDNELVVVRKPLQALNDALLDVYKNLPDLELNVSFSFSLQLDDKVTQHATYKLGEKIYVKVSVNDTYIGWIDQSYVKEKEFELYNVKPYHTISTASYPLKQPIWNQIRKNNETDEIITYIGYFKDRYIETDKIAKTSGGRYVRVKYNGKVIGWMSPRPLKRTHKISSISPLKLYFNNKLKKKELASPVVYTSKIERVRLYGKLNTTQSIDIYNEPKGTTNSVVISTSENYVDEILLIDKIAWMGQERYYSISLSTNEKIGYIQAEFVDELSEETYKILKRKEAQDRIEAFSLPKVDLSYQKVPDFDDSYYNIVNMGRLSPEKNQTHLIEAFAKFNQDVPKSRLFILGKGPLVSSLIETIKTQNMLGKVFLLGHIKNPFNFIKRTDLFVLPSYYEGQPMVLLESMVLGLNILGSNIPANINVIGKDEEYGFLTDGTEIEDIYKGFHRIFQFKGKFKTFDYVNYNKKTIQRFYKEIDPNNK